VKRVLGVLLLSGLFAGAILIGSGNLTFADPNLPNIPPHRHFVRNADGQLVEVGPRVCDNPKLQTAFNQFHANTHTFVAGSLGPVAPGLHNGVGGEVLARGC
jgi:hypothetical protein